MVSRVTLACSICSHVIQLNILKITFQHSLHNLVLTFVITVTYLELLIDCAPLKSNVLVQQLLK